MPTETRTLVAVAKVSGMGGQSRPGLEYRHTGSFTIPMRSLKEGTGDGKAWSPASGIVGTFGFAQTGAFGSVNDGWQHGGRETHERRTIPSGFGMRSINSDLQNSGMFPLEYDRFDPATFD